MALSRFEVERMNISLINMPFCYLESPSLALAQLRPVLLEDEFLADRISVDICHAQHDFAEMLGLQLCNFFADSEDIFAGVLLLGTFLFPRTDAEHLTYVERFPADRNEPLLNARDVSVDDLDRPIGSHDLAESDVVGMSSLYQQSAASLTMAKRIKERFPDKICVLGGGNCEGQVGKALIRNFDCVDYVFSGCGLVSFVEFVRHVESGNLAACDMIDAVFSRRNRCSLTWDVAAKATAVPSGLVTEVVPAAGDNLPEVGMHGKERAVGEVVTIDYTDFLESFETRIAPLGPGVKPRLPLETSRGCWWGEKSHCTFCGSRGWDISYRQMAPGQAIRYFNSAIEKHSASTPYFECADQLIPKDFPEKVMPDLRLPDSAGLFYEIRTTISEEHMRKLRDAGVRTVQPGVEALSSDLLKHMAKGVTGAHNIQHLKRCAALGMTPMWALLVGLPKEDPAYYDFYRKTLGKLVHLPPPMTVSPVGFHRNGPYTWYPSKYGLDISYAEVYEQIYDLPPEEMRDFAYFFEDRTPDPDNRRNVEEHGAELGLVVEIWRRAWVGRDGDVPQLHALAGSGGLRILDTRTGAGVIHDISADERAVLQAFETPTALGAIKRRGIVPDSALLPALKSLRQKGLLFIEGGRGISLVLDEPAPLPEFARLLRAGEVVLH
jgi:ribosomal peptide maturation radical SAM protein 1